MHTFVPVSNTFYRDYGWHSGRFHFSFGDYVDPANAGFGVLCAINDFCVRPEKGFTTHGHAEVEIISLVLEGTLVHRDGLGNEEVLTRGDCQYTRTGAGILHSEMNGSRQNDLRFVQLWVEPNEKRLSPFYSPITNPCRARKSHTCLIASGGEEPGVQRIAQDANVYLVNLLEQDELVFSNLHSRQCLILCLEGAARAADKVLRQNDSLRVWDRETVTMAGIQDSCLLIVEMAQR